MVGAAAALFLSYEIGKKAGGWIYDHLSKHTQDSIGGAIAHVLAALGDKDAQQAVADHDRFSRAQPPQVHHHHIHIDGKKVADVVTRHQAHTIQQPPVGPSNSISSFTLPHTSQAY